MSKMFDELDTEVENAEAWVAEPEDKITGKIVKIDHRDGGYGEYPILTIEVDEGTVGGKPIKVPALRSIHCMATVIMGEVGWNRDRGAWGEDRTAFVGGTVGMKYLGKKQGRTNEYDAWRVIIEPPASVGDQLDDDSLFTA